VHREYKDRGLTVLAVDMKEPRDTVAAWVRKSSVTFDVLLDSAAVTARAYRVTVTPTVFLIGRDGKLLAKAIGTKRWTGPKGRALLDAMLVK
jgi:cytochrome c biogenesis protein CcmG, thiol:disulfide interchange protein DsbE